MEIENLKRQLAETKKLLEQERKARQAPAREETTTLPIEQAKDWEEAQLTLPKHPVTGKVDWIAALDKKTIIPRPGIEPDAAEKAVFDLNVKISRTTGGNSTLPDSMFQVTYPHEPHTRWLTCNNCHEKIFALSAAKRPAISMSAIKDGRYCGECHGKVAFAVEDACGRCHTGMATTSWESPTPANPLEAAKSFTEAEQHLPTSQNTVDWVKALDDGLIEPRAGLTSDAQHAPVLPIDIERIPPGNPLFKVVFPHKAHTQWLTCNNCHTKIFAMQKGANPITMPKIFAGEYCGVCHGKVAFPLQACGRCHAALAQGDGK